jgi:putative ATP-binding cassette transporter
MPQMKTDLASTLPILASHPPPEGTPEVLQSTPPGVPTMPVVAAKRAFADDDTAVRMQDFDLARDLSLFVRVLRRAEGGQRVLAIFVTSVAVTIANMLAQVRLNEWNGQFFDAVGRKDL